jgi:glycosyltransferase involved in cell wall biosynthesis
MSKDLPKVSIGMPVYNGELYIREALDSILRQTFTDFELIVSDNNSSDRTSEICREYAAKDKRISYYRSEVNMGAAWNHNRVFELARGQYFKWLAHDDVYAIDFLAKCVEILDRDASVVLCHSQVRIINSEGNFLKNYDIKLNTNSPNPNDRFHDLLSKHLCYQFFGLIRADTVKKVFPIGNYGHGDGVFLLKLGLLGRFYEIPERLFSARNHPQQSMNKYIPNYMEFTKTNYPSSFLKILPDYHAYAVWFDPLNANKILFPHWRIAREYWQAIRQSPLSLSERLCCYQSMSKQLKGTKYLLIEDLIKAFKTIVRRFYQIYFSEKLTYPKNKTIG